MTARNPLVLIPGGNPQIQELPSGDTIYGAPAGPQGLTGTIAVGTTTTLSPGSSATVSNSGTTTAAVFNFGIPQGTTGATGPAGGYGQLAQIVTASSQATVDFTNIAGTYSTLKVIYFCRDTTSGTGNSLLRLKINNDGTAANYTSTFRVGTDNAANFASNIASSTAGVYVNSSPNDGNTAGICCHGEITIIGYAGTTFHKRILSYSGMEDGTPNTTVQLIHARWISTAAITRLTFIPGTAFKDGSTFTLYGLQ